MDFGTCEQPDEMIQLAWNAGLDKKLVLREASDAANLLDDRSDTRRLFWPAPGPLEAVDRWTGNSRTQDGITQGLRPHASAVIPGCVIGYFLTRTFVTATGDAQLMLELVIIVASIAALGFLFKGLVEVVLRRRAAALDEERALAIVLEQLRIGMIKNAALAPRAAVWIRRGLTR